MSQAVSIFIVGSVVVACTARVERAPVPGETVRAHDFMMELGGKGYNCAVAASRLGGTVDGLFAVGDDALGRFARDAFRQSGLCADLLSLPGSTGGGVGLIEPDGENRIAVHPGANDRLTARHVHAAASRIAQASLTIAQFEVGNKVIGAAFAVARQAGGRTLLNPSPFRPISAEILRLTDILVVNAGEAAALARSLNLDWPSHPEEQVGAWARLAQCLFNFGLAMLVITVGAAGASIYEPARSLQQPAFQVDAVDTIGAGDAFVGGLAKILAEKGETAAALRWACGAGAMATRRFGLLDALPDHLQLTEFLATATLRP